MGPNALEVVRSNSACILLEHGEVEQQIHRQSLQRLRALTSTRSSTPVRTFGREPSAQSRRVRWSSAARSTVCSRGTRRWSFVTDAAFGGGRWFRRSWGKGGRKTRQVDGTAMVSTLRMSWIPATDEPCQGLGDNMRGVVSSYQFPLGAGGSTGRSLPIVATHGRIGAEDVCEPNENGDNTMHPFHGCTGTCLTALLPLSFQNGGRAGVPSFVLSVRALHFVQIPCFLSQTSMGIKSPSVSPNRFKRHTRSESERCESSLGDASSMNGTLLFHRAVWPGQCPSPCP